MSLKLSMCVFVCVYVCMCACENVWQYQCICMCVCVCFCMCFCVCMKKVGGGLGRAMVDMTPKWRKKRGAARNETARLRGKDDRATSEQVCVFVCVYVCVCVCVCILGHWMSIHLHWRPFLLCLFVFVCVFVCVFEGDGPSNTINSLENAQQWTSWVGR